MPKVHTPTVPAGRRTQEIVLKFRARDSRTGERLYPGDKVMFTPKRFYWKTVVDEKTGEPKKLFLNEYILVERCRKPWPKRNKR